MDEQNLRDYDKRKSKSQYEKITIERMDAKRKLTYIYSL